MKSFKIILLISLMFLLVKVCLSAPSNSISVPNTFTPNTTISSSDTNANNNEIQTKYNAHTHTDITQVGTITSGVWNGSIIAIARGGTGKNLSSTVQGSIPYFSATGTLSTLAPSATSGLALTTGGTGANPTWSVTGDMVYTHSRAIVGNFTITSGTLVIGTTYTVSCGYQLQAVQFITNTTGGSPTASWGMDNSQQRFVVHTTGTGASAGFSSTANGSLVGYQTAEISLYGRVDSLNPKTFTIGFYDGSGDLVNLLVEWIGYR